MKTERIVMEGLGGQGVLSAGRFLGEVAIRSGLHATFSPAYGAEVRGGMAHCEVVVSDEPVKGFLVEEPTSAFLMSGQAWEARQADLPEGCLALINSSLVEAGEYAGPARLVRVPASRIADELGAPRVMNTVLLGAWAGLTGLIELERFVATLPEVLGERYQDMIDINAEALRRGHALAEGI